MESDLCCSPTLLYVEIHKKDDIMEENNGRKFRMVFGTL